MTRPPKWNSDDDLRRFDEAAVWHSKRRQPLSPSETQQWLEWERDETNKEAYCAVELAAQSRRLIALPPRPTPKELAEDTFDGSIPLAEWRAKINPAGSYRSIRAWLWGGIGVAASLAVVLVVPRMVEVRGSKNQPVQIIETQSGEKMHVTLEDGSQVFLGDRTKLTVRYEHCQRTIDLNEGEALFNVVHDPACPFIVIAGNGAIRALGTQFSVRRTLDHVTVTVAEGAVNVQPHQPLTNIPARSATSAPQWDDAVLSKGQEVSFYGSSHRSPVESEDPQVATAWLEGHREYRHEPLAYVVADIERYFGKRIVIRDEAVGRLQFTGRVYESQVADWLQALQTIFPVEVSQPDGEQIVIQAAHF